MTEERLAEIERTTAYPHAGLAMTKMAAEVRRCWRQIAKLQAANNEELGRRRKAEDVIRELRAVKLPEAGLPLPPSSNDLKGLAGNDLKRF